MVSRRMSGDPAPGLGIREGEDRIDGSPELERPHALEVLALEEEGPSRKLVHGPAGQDRRAVGMRLDPLRGPADLFKDRRQARLAHASTVA